MQCLDVLRALRREPAAAERFAAELEEGDRVRVESALAGADEEGVRRLVEKMAVALQSTLLARHGDPAVAETFRARVRSARSDAPGRPGARRDRGAPARPLTGRPRHQPPEGFRACTAERSGWTGGSNSLSLRGR